MPGQTTKNLDIIAGVQLLQWRAEQLPGQTSTLVAAPRRRMDRFNGGPSNCPAKLPVPGRPPSVVDCASMEGRAIARPNVEVLLSDLLVQEVASMEGRAIARPNMMASRDPAMSKSSLQWRAEQLPGQTDEAILGGWWTNMLQWRAEQLPGQTSASGARPRGNAVLQWRAEQLPGQTGPDQEQLRVGDHASMEGRAIARPNQSSSWSTVLPTVPLQWRAEQLPGQTMGLRRHQKRGARFNGGPSNCPAKPLA